MAQPNSEELKIAAESVENAKRECHQRFGGYGVTFRHHKVVEVRLHPDALIAAIASALADAREARPDEVATALAELRGMQKLAASTLSIAQDRRTEYFTITVWPVNGELSEEEFGGATLSEAMAKVREWAIRVDIRREGGEEDQNQKLG